MGGNDFPLRLGMSTLSKEEQLTGGDVCWNISRAHDSQHLTISCGQDLESPSRKCFIFSRKDALGEYRNFISVRRLPADFKAIDSSTKGLVK